MNKQFLKRNKLDKLDLSTLLTIVKLTTDRAHSVKISAILFGYKGSHSPKKLEARKEELLMYADFLKAIAEALKK
jgi:hypothetical protein